MVWKRHWKNLSKEDLIKVISSRDQALVEQQRIVDSLTKDSTQKDRYSRS